MTDKYELPGGHRITTQDIRRTQEKRNELALPIVEAYRTRFHTPDLLTETWAKLWEYWGIFINTDVAVVQCNRTEEEIKNLEGQRRMMIYVPYEVSTSTNRHLLGDLFPMTLHPGLRTPREGNNAIDNLHDQFGWLDVEAGQETPLRRSLESFKKNLRTNVRSGLTLNTYIIGSNFRNLTSGNKGRYFDAVPNYGSHQDFKKYGWVDLLGSVEKFNSTERYPRCYFMTDGYINRSDYHSEIPVGYRSSWSKI